MFYVKYLILVRMAVEGKVEGWMISKRTIGILLRSDVTCCLLLVFKSGSHLAVFLQTIPFALYVVRYNRCLQLFLC